ncbi:DUF3810 domain-containing protein [Proteiniborus sp. MB09-C3]|uniref:DUF3810 domain-containing protein n=1 Tax=Proteiniborus sp. MB09-C3 TaxID=3050072 RepID=UPI002553340E|nr:DUF3810 domain-containing protein [Proteiniborus sp. MB09-C3]WIV13812.1 DUF3810 domain-containing protein [Proteiniborus sp. MB09-C3]
MKAKIKINSIWFLILLPLGFILVFISQRNPNLVEKLYSSGIYKYIGATISITTGILPFSLGEVLVIFSLLFIIVSIIWILYKAVTRRMGYKKVIIYVRNVLVALSIVYFLFNILWGLNYYRLPFSKIANIDARPATIHELVALCDDLIIKTNELRRKIDLSKDSKSIENDYKYILKNAYKGYEVTKAIYPELGGSYGRPKGVLLSKAMSYMGITGIYFPFTGEANVNIDTPMISLPSTVTHEMAHQRGFAREDEANYIAYITCKLHPDLDFQYSGYILALTHSMNVLYSNDKEQFNELSKKYSNGVKEDLININRHWAQYEGPIEKASNKMNNAYLKSNNQKDGVKSYGRMVDLLIAEYRMKNK